MRSYSLFVVAVPLSCAFSPCPPLATSFAKDRKQPFYLFMSESQDGEVLQSLFAKQCDPDGLMTKETLTQVQSISDLLAEGDLLPEELEDIWNAAPKFPTTDDRIDVDSFIQIYRDIDDLFDDGEQAAPVPAPTQTMAEAPVTEDEEDPDEQDMATVFAGLCDNEGLVSKESLRNWDEIQELINEGLLGEDELDEIWTKTIKSPGSNNRIDVEGFLSLNVALDELFVFDEDEEAGPALDAATEVAATRKPVSAPAKREMVSGADLPPGVLFAALANEDYLVGMKELSKWQDLQDMLREGDLLPEELLDLMAANAPNGLLDEAGFVAVYEAIDSLFEDTSTEGSKIASAKGGLLNFLSALNNDDDRLPCGLECTDREINEVMRMVTSLENENSNVVRRRQGDIRLNDLTGKWELLYSSSSAMKFNKGLSGLGGSFPNGKFAGLTMLLTSSKFMSDVEYLERIEVNPSSASFDVKVNGDWGLRKSVSLFTGEPSTVLNVVPERVEYGPTSTRADHWKSLGPMNMLDLTYLDDDLRIMRGNTSTENIFIYKRVS